MESALLEKKMEETKPPVDPGGSTLKFVIRLFDKAGIGVDSPFKAMTAPPGRLPYMHANILPEIMYPPLRGSSTKDIGQLTYLPKQKESERE